MKDAAETEEAGVVDIKDGKVSIGVSYGVKVPGDARFTSQEKSTWLTLEYTVDGEAGAAAVDKALELETQLDTAVKLSVLSSLGLQPNYIAEGVIVPTWPADKPEPQRQQQPRQAPSGGGGGNGGFRTPPKVNPSSIPTVTLADGRQVQDLRPMKLSGVYKPNAADFKVDGRSLWLTARDGSQNPEAASIAAALDGPATEPF